MHYKNMTLAELEIARNRIQVALLNANGLGKKDLYKCLENINNLIGIKRKENKK